MTNNISIKTGYLALFVAFSVIVVATLFAYASPVSADDTVVITNNNSAEITNNVEVEAETGDNESEGDEGGNGGSGGSGGDEGSGGSGGSGGAGGAGGSITTGSATAISTITNDVNNNDIDVEEIPDGDDDDGFWWWSDDETLVVTNNNSVGLSNNVEVEAETGDNESEGDEGGNGGSGGSGSGGAGGAGGAGGSGGAGGPVSTGVADSDSLIVNVVNTNVTRVVVED